MTDRDRKVLAAVVALVVLGGFWFLVIGKKRSAIKDAQAAQIAAQADLETAKNAEQAALKVAKVKPAAYSRLLRLGKAIPEDEDFESLLVQINDITLDSNVTFVNLSAAAATPGASAGATGSTTCDTTGSTGGSTGATAAAPASGSTGAPAGPTGSTAQTWVGKDRDKAKNAVAASDSAEAKTDTASSKAIDCADSPSLTDIAASAAGLDSESYTLNFTGSFYNLQDVFNGIQNLVKVHNGRVSVTGRLLDINSIALSVSEFPQLSASVQMTGYQLPVSAAAAEGTASGTVTPNASATAAVNTANNAQASSAGAQ